MSSSCSTESFIQKINPTNTRKHLLEPTTVGRDQLKLSSKSIALFLAGLQLSPGKIMIHGVANNKQKDACIASVAWVASIVVISLQGPRINDDEDRSTMLAERRKK